MSDDNVLRIEIDASGAAKASAELQRVSKAVDATTEATKKNTTAVAAQAEKFKIGSVEVDKFGSTLGVAGQAVGRLNSTAGQMVTSLGAATGAIQSMATAGLGPLGIAITAANLAITAGVTLWGEYEEAQRSAQARIDSLKKSFDDLLAAQRASNQEASRERRLAAGQGTAEEQDAYLAQTTQLQNRLIELGGDENVNAAQALEPTRRLRARMAGEARAREMAAAEDAALISQNAAQLAENRRIIAANEPTTPRGGARGGRGSMVAAREGLDENARKYIAGKASGFANAEAMRVFEEREAEREAEATRLAVEAQKNRDLELYESRMQAEQKITDMLAEEEDRRKSLAEEADAARIDSMQRTADAIQSIGSMMTQIYGFVDDAGASADESEEQREKKRLKRLAFSQSVEAIVNAAQSVVAFARQDYVGGAMYAVASGLNIAAAAKAGVDAGNVPSTGAAGGSAGSAMRNDSRSSSQANREPVTVVVNMNGPVVATADRAELGRQINQLVSEGRGRYGEAA